MITSKSSSREHTKFKKINSHVHEACPSRTAALDGITEALKHGKNNNIIGVCGSDSNTADLIVKVSRRGKKDKLFNVVVMATASHKPNNKKIQDEIAETLGLKFDYDEKHVGKRAKRLRFAEVFCLKFGHDEKDDVAERAKRLRDRILRQKKILVILCDLHKGLDLDKVGIPLRADHIGCKLLLTSASEEVLSKQMRAQKIFKV